MGEFTKEEISLCKQVAERHRKPIKYGDWVYTYKKEITLVISPIGKLDWSIRNYKVLPEQEGRGFYCVHENKNEYIPLWTISDCLEFLKGKKWKVVELREDWIGGFWVLDLDRQDTKHEPLHLVGKTTLEACLKTVLAVLEEKEK